MFFILTKLPFVSLALCPDVLAVTVHDSFFPLPTVNSSITPLVSPQSADYIILPLANELGAVCPDVCSTAFFFAINVFSVILGTVDPGLYSWTVLPTTLPLALINSPICMFEYPMPWHQIEGPTTFVGVSICVAKSTSRSWLIITPESTIACTIWPYHSPLAMSKSSEPLTLVRCSRRLVMINFSNFYALIFEALPGP